MARKTDQEDQGGRFRQTRRTRANVSGCRWASPAALTFGVCPRFWRTGLVLMVRPDRFELPTFWFIVLEFSVRPRLPCSFFNDLRFLAHPSCALFWRCFRAGSCHGSCHLAGRVVAAGPRQLSYRDAASRPVLKPCFRVTLPTVCSIHSLISSTVRSLRFSSSISSGRISALSSRMASHCS